MTAGAGILHIEAPPEALVVSGGLSTHPALGEPARVGEVGGARYQDIRAGQVSLLTHPTAAPWYGDRGEVAGHAGRG